MSLCVLSAALALVLSGCGLGTAREQREQPLSLLLDAPPSAVHAGIYVATQRDFDRGEGLALQVRKRRATSRPAALLRSEQVDAAVLELADFASARTAGDDLVAVAALVQTPLTAILARAPTTAPRHLERRSVGVPPGRLGRALVATMVDDDGGDIARVNLTRFEPAREPAGDALSGSRLDAVVGRRDSELAAAKGIDVLRPEAHGVPRYPELVIVVKRRTLAEREGALRALIRTLQRGYTQAQADPESAVGALLEREPRLERASLLAQMDVVASAWTAGAPAFGVLDPEPLRAWQRWAVRHRVLRRAPRLEEAFAFNLVGRLANP